MTTRWQSVHQPALRCWLREPEIPAQVYHFKNAPSPYDLKAADLTTSRPVFGDPTKPPDNLAAAPLTSSAPEFTAAVLLLHKPAKTEDIWSGIDIALNEAMATQKKPPSPRELRRIVLPWLLARGLRRR